MIAILAQSMTRGTGLTAAQKWFTRSDPGVLRQVVIVLMLLGAGLFVGWLSLQLQQRYHAPARFNPKGLFRRTQRKLGLSLPEQWLMWRLAGTLKLPHPTTLLISRNYFDEAVQKFAKNTPSARFAAIRAKLFPGNT